jgi:di/tricarboxylate transporter
MDLAWLSLIALVVVVVVSCTLRTNPGVVAIVFAWLIAFYAAPHFGQSLNLEILFAGFPTDLFLTLVGVSLLFTQAEANGTLARIARLTERLCRGNLGLIPVMFLLFALALGTVGPGNIAVAGLVAPIAMSVAYRVGIPPFLMAIMVGHGAIASTLSPFTAAGVLVDKLLAEMGLAGNEWRVYAYNAAINTAVGLGGYLLFGGWRLFGRWHIEEAPVRGVNATGATDEQSTKRLDRQFGITLTVIAAVVVGVVAFKMQIGMVAFAGAVILSMSPAANEREIFQKMPWSVIVMVCGVSMLTHLLDKTGGTKRLAELITTVSTPYTVTAVLAFVTGVVSVYSSTTGVVLPAFLPIVKNMIAVHSYANPLALALAVLIGGNLVDVSPLSTIGALCVAATTAGIDRRALFNKLLAWGFAQSLVGAIVCWTLFSPG